MERDKIIAIVLVLGFVFLMVAIIGVVTVTGFVLLFVANDAPVVDNTPIIDSTGSGAHVPAGSPIIDTTPATQVDDPEPEPVCGNGEWEDGEECEIVSDCNSSNMQCNSCKCEAIPVPEAQLLEDIEVESLTFWCAKDFEGKDGLAVKIIKFKNNGSTDFSYDKKLTLTSEAVGASDSISTVNVYKFSVDAGKTTDIYQKDMFRSDAPFLFLGDSPGNTTITIEFGNDYYIEHKFNLRMQDFIDAYCQ